MVNYLVKESLTSRDFFENFIETAFNFGEGHDSQNIKHFILLFMAEFPINFKIKTPYLEKWIILTGPFEKQRELQFVLK